MTQFTKALNDWNSETFTQSLKDEIEHLSTGALPLEHGANQGGKIDDSNITATVLNFTEETSTISSKVGIFFTEVVGGCNCDDDPIEINSYCEVVVNINKSSAEVIITALYD